MLEDTGERIIIENLDPMNIMLLEHLARYHFALPYCRGRVLDIACGTGYGSKMIAKERKKYVSEVIGADISVETIDYASKKYQHPLLSYSLGDVLDPRFIKELGSFDTVISFETIEHVEDELLFMKHMKELLKPGGRLLLSTPFGEGLNIPSGHPFHFFQMTVEEFKSLFQTFSSVEYYFQRGVMFEPPRPDIHYPIGVAIARK